MEGNVLARKEARCDNPDRLSMLPDSLLLVILSPLKAREIAQTTCILSKRWFKLCFDIADFLKANTRKVTGEVLEKYRNFVTSFLSARDEASNIDAFRLLCLAMDFNVRMEKRRFDKIVASAEKWVLHGLKHNLKTFKVSFRRQKSSCIEMLLMGCLSIENLSLDDCMLSNFSSLTVKRLQLSRCLNLRDDHQLTIFAPGVEGIELDMNKKAKITLKDASRATRAVFSSCDDLENM